MRLDQIALQAAEKPIARNGKYVVAPSHGGFVRETFRLRRDANAYAQAVSQVLNDDFDVLSGANVLATYADGVAR